MKTLFAVTHINRDHMRTLSHANQGRNHFPDKEGAQRSLDAMLDNTSRDTLIQVFGEQAIGTFAVRPVTCYDHGDAVGIFFDN